MWPRGNPHEQLAAIDDRLDAIRATLDDAKAWDPGGVEICRQLLDELLEERNRIAAMIPKQREPAD
jgi:hypothetical protein